MIFKSYPPTKGIIFYSCIYLKTQLDEKTILRELNLDPNACEILFPSFNPSLDYYSREMGELSNLVRFIIAETVLVDRKVLVEKKLSAIKIEEKYADKNSKNRILNIDPGLLTLDQVLLSTSKPYAHRIFLDQDIYAELNYIFENGDYKALAWTYPDYNNSEKLEFFKKLRSKIFQKKA